MNLDMLNTHTLLASVEQTPHCIPFSAIAIPNWRG